MIWCLKCKSKTETNGLEIVTLKNGKSAETGMCSVCNDKKFKLVTSLRSGDKQVIGGDLVGFINSITKDIKLPNQRYPGEMHYPGANFMGPGTRLDLRLNPDGPPKPDSMPINRVDEAAYRHDLRYNQFTDTMHRNKADELMTQEIDAIENPTPKERLMRAAATPILLGKSKLGLGVSQTRGLKKKLATDLD